MVSLNLPGMGTFEENTSALVELFRHRDPTGEEMGRIFRETFDQAYDGQHTGRFRPEDLSKTELAHIGSLVEINIRRHFADVIDDGFKMDFRIADLEVDCKYSKAPFGWMIPLETVGNYAMLCHANEVSSTFRVGFVYVTDDILNVGGNRDRKRTISLKGREHIQWVWYDEPYPRNVLLHLHPDDAEFIMESRSGQERINNLFRVVQDQIIPRGIIYTVAQQKDPMKRIRYNGGARSALLPEGILILGDYKRHTRIAEELGLPIPKDGDSVAVRVVETSPLFKGPVTEIDGRFWRIATQEDPHEDAPIIPKK